MKQTALLTLCLTATTLCANDESRMRNIENRMTALEDSQNGCCIINPSARPYNPCDWGLYLEVDPFVWQAHAAGIAPAIRTSGSTEFFNDSGQSRVENLNFDWNWGFRAGLGLNHIHDEWDTLLQWTHWKSCASIIRDAETTRSLYPHLGHPAQITGLTNSASSVKSDWDITLNFLDLENGRAFYVSRYFSLRPFAGLRTAWLCQDFDTKYTGLTIQNTDETYLVDQASRYWGIGIRGGIDMQWGIITNWSIFSSYSTSLLYNYFSVKHKESVINTAGDKIPLVDVANFYHLGSSITDMQIGLRFSWTSCSRCFHIGLDIGWEHLYLPEQEKFLLFVDATMPGKYVDNLGSLAAQGYFLKIRLDF